MKLTYRLDVLNVAFQGAAPAVQSTLAGHTQIVPIVVTAVAPFINDGKLRGLGVADHKPSPAVPDVPTLEEQGITGHEVGFWIGAVVPAGTPKVIVDLLRDGIAEATTQPDVKKCLAEVGFEPAVGTSQAFGTFMKAPAKRPDGSWATVPARGCLPSFQGSWENANIRASSADICEIPVDIVHRQSGGVRPYCAGGMASPFISCCWGDVMRMRTIFSACIAAGVLVFGGTAEAQTPQQITSCEGKDSPSPDAMIAGCTAMIQSGKYSGHNLAINFNNRCSAYFDNGEYDLAIKDCDRAIKIDPNYARPYYNRSLSYYKKEDYDQTIKDANEAIRLDPSNADAFDTRGNAYSDKWDHDRAIRDYNESIRLKPNNPITLANRCDELALIRQFRASLLDCDESLKIRPDHPNTLLHRALTHLALGDLDDALADYANVLRQKPKDAQALYGRGMIKLKKGDVAGANDDMSSAKAVQQDIADVFASYGLTAEKR